MAFKKMRGIKLPYNKQGYIFFHCKEYNSLSEQDKQYIVNLCKEQCGDYWQAVFEFITTEKPIQKISIDNFISDNTIYRLKRKVFENFKILPNQQQDI